MIRLARADEAEQVAALVQRAYQPWAELLGRKPAPMLDDYPARVAARQCWVMPAHETGSLAAISILEPQAGRLLLDNVAVDPAQQGKRLGIAMIAHAIGVAAGSGSAELLLYTHQRMERNIALYARLGFQEIERKLVGAHARVYMSLPIH